MTERQPGDRAIEQAMRRAIELAEQGPLTGGNPRVGCVLLDDGGRPVAEGWHRGAGTAHAEVDALAHVADAAGLTAVVSLEPCNVTGRTGPCTEALISAGVRRVVYAVDDPASGGGAARLREAGIEVRAGVLGDDAERLNHEWLTAVRRGVPWVTVKWASTLDGRAYAADRTSQWITSAATQRMCHHQRAQNDAILVGTGTVLADDPRLTARGDDGELFPHQPVPVVVGERPVPAGAKLRAHPAGLIETGTRDIGAVLTDLYARGHRRVYVEGGPVVASAVIREGFADEYAIFLAPSLLGGPGMAIGDLGVGTLADAIRLRLHAVERVGDDLYVNARRA